MCMILSWVFFSPHEADEGFLFEVQDFLLRHQRPFRTVAAGKDIGHLLADVNVVFRGKLAVLHVVQDRRWPCRGSSRP